MNQKICILNQPSYNSASTLLIPEYLWTFFVEKKRKMGGMNKLFQFILSGYHPVLFQKTMSRNGKICYQPERLGLRRVNFFPDNNDWEKFRLYAQQQRISMTFLFVLILMNWEDLKHESIGVPSHSVKISFLQSLNITEIFTYLEIQRFLL